MPNLKQTLKFFKLNESVISVLLGALVVVIVGVFATRWLGTISQTPGQITSQAAQQTLEGLPEAIGSPLASGQVIALTPKSPAPTTASTKEVPKPAIAEANPTPVAAKVVLKAPGTTHVVAQGESLWTISQQYYSGSGYNWVDIASANNLNNPNHVIPGQTLVIPTVTIRQPVAVAQAQIIKPAGTTITGSSYTIVKGDSLWSIAVRAYGDGFQWNRIYQANKAKIGNPRLIHSGNSLIIPR